MRAIAIAQQHLALIEHDNDLKLALDTIEGQSNAMEILDLFIEDMAKDRSLIDIARKRALRIEKRYDGTKATVLRMLEALGLMGHKIERPVGTLWVTHHASVILTGPVPDEYMRHTEDIKRIHKELAAGKQIENATLSNPEPSLHLLTR